MNVTEHTYTDGRGRKITYTKRKKTTEIILHCSATPEGKDYTVDTINKWHNARGFSGIGYNYVVYRDGSIHRGRPKWATGAHCFGHNSNSIGICYIGGLAADGKTAKDTRTEAQKESVRWLVKVLLPQYKLTLADVHCHNEFANKACPSFKIGTFREEYER